MITCPECGAQNDDGAKFCERCGQGIAGAAARRWASVAIITIFWRYREECSASLSVIFLAKGFPPR